MKSTAPVKLGHMLKNIRYWFPSLSKAKFIPVKDLSIEKALLKIEHNHVTYNYKFGVLYAKDGQDENEMFGNCLYFFSEYFYSMNINILFFSNWK